MMPPFSITGTLARSPLFRHARTRRSIFLVLITICAMLTLFPQKYRAALSLTPADPAAIGLGDTVRQLGALNSMFGNQTALEVSLKVARSRYVRDIVSKQLDLPRRLGKSSHETDRWLDREMDIRAVRGGILQFEMKFRDGEFARQIVAAYGEAVRQQLAIIARRQTAYKRQILLNLVGDASGQLAQAQNAYDTFRLRARASVPELSISASARRVSELEEAIKAKQVELAAQREFNTDQNIMVRQLRAETAELQRQLAEARSTSPADDNSVGRTVKESTEVERLRRNLMLAQLLYDSYKRFLQGTTVEDLTSTANVRILEPAYIDTARQYNLIPLALGLLILLLALAIEFYTLRPAVGDRITA